MPNDPERFRKMVEESQDWFWEFDEHAVFTYVSPRIRDLLGYEPEELLGLNAFDLMSPEEAERVHKHFDPLAKKYLPFNNLENINVHKDGHEVIIESSGTPIFDEEGRFRGYRGIDRDVTERKRIEQGLHEKEETYKLLVENQNDLVVKVDTDGRFLFVSPSYCTTFGKSEAELLGRSFMPLVHEEDQAVTAEAMKALLYPPHTAYMEQRALTVDGWRWLAWSDRAILDDKGQIEAIVGVGRDITLSKQVKEELRTSKEKLQNIIDTSTDWIWEMDLSGQHTFTNNRLLELLGYSVEEFIGKNYVEFLHEDDLRVVHEKLPQLISEQRGWNGWVLRWRHKDGSYRFLESNAKPILDSKGEIVGYSGTDRDITERKASEMALIAATEAAEAASRAKDVFLAKVSHEIRTPLTAIVGFGELLEEADLIPEFRKYLDAINSSGRALGALIDDILDLSKVETGKLAIKVKEFSLPSLINQLMATKQQQIEEKNLSSSISIDTDVPELVIGDPLRIQQVLLNLVGNAIKFTAKGTIDIAVSVVEDSPHRILLDIAVKDTGIGIPASLQEKIFEPFAQISDADNHKQGGSGLGLTISRGLASLMGGSVRTESQEGIGSTFHLLIPLQREKGSLAEKSLSEREVSLWNGPSLDILLAEDNPINTFYIKTVLNNTGHAVTVAENGKIALDAIKSKTFDLVLMDIQMPLMSGTEALNVLRDMEKMTGKHLTVIALTAYALIGDKEKYLKMGFDGYLSKPVTTGALLAEMERVVPG